MFEGKNVTVLKTTLQYMYIIVYYRTSERTKMPKKVPKIL